MGWVGVERAFTAWEQDKKEEERFNRGLIEQRKNTLIPYLTKAYAANAEKQAESRDVLSFFNNRLDGLSETERKAYLNIIRDNPEMGKAIYSTITRHETQWPGMDLSGPALLEFSNIIDQTKPDNMSIEEYTEMAASSVGRAGTSRGISDMISNILNANDIDTMETLSDVMEATASSPGIQGGLPNFTVPVGMRPGEEKQYEDRIYTRLEARLTNEINALTAESNKRTSQGLSVVDVETERTRLTTLKTQAGDNPYNLIYEFPDLTKSLLLSIAANDPYVKNSLLYANWAADVSNM